MRAYVISARVEEEERKKERGGKREGDGIGARCTEGPKLRKGTAWPRNKCGFCRITAIRDAGHTLAVKTTSAKNGE